MFLFMPSRIILLRKFANLLKLSQKSASTPSVRSAICLSKKEHGAQRMD